jgi:hypothetical protein
MQALTGFVQDTFGGLCLVALFPGAPPPVYWASDDGRVPLSLTPPDPFGWVTTCH